MKRAELWMALVDASEVLQAASAAARREPTPATCMQADAAIPAFLDCLPPLIGHKAAFRFEASWRAFKNAREQQEQLTAAIAARPLIDMEAADAGLMRHVQRELDDTHQAFEHVSAETQAALHEAQARDRRHAGDERADPDERQERSG